MKQKVLIRVLLGLLLLSAILCGTVFALMFHQTELYENRLEAARVSCVVHEKMDGGTETMTGVALGEKKTSIKVQNTGNISAYIRLRFVTYWVDLNGNIIGKPSEMPQISITNWWQKGSDGNYYYKTPVAPGEFTEALLSAPIELQADLDHAHYQVVEVFADAIQSQPTAAVTESWDVTIDGDGKIT